jgi:hypothetical protein
MKDFTVSDLAPITADVSDKYVVIDSEILVNELQARGFVPHKIMRSKTGSRVHTVRMRTQNAVEINGEMLFPEVIIRNSYDKTCAFSVQTGIFRLVCSNGLTVRVKDTKGDFFKTRHIGNEAMLAAEIALEFSENLASVWQVQELLVKKELSDDQMIKLAMRAARIRWQQEFTPEQAAVLLAVARPEDAGNSAWHVFNRLQENTLKGGVKIGEMKKTPRPIGKAKTHADINDQIFDAVYEMVTTDDLVAMN